MSGRELLCSNLDFEYAWSAQQLALSHKRTPMMARICTRWQHILQLLPPLVPRVSERLSLQLDEEGRWCTPDGERYTPQAGDQLRPWGWTEEQLGWVASMKEEGGPRLIPGRDAILWANQKLTSHQIEETLGLATPMSQVISSLEQLEQALHECPHSWVTKHPWGVSGRDRIQGPPGHMEQRHLGWARRQLRKGWALLFEPWLEEGRAYSTHFDVSLTPSGEVSVDFVGCCRLMTDGSGTHRGNEVSADWAPPGEAIAWGHQICQILGEKGYFGPVGIDGMSGWLGGSLVHRPLVEINARYTFGRLTLSLGQWVPEGARWAWWHPTKDEVLPWDVSALVPLDALTEVSGERWCRLPEVADPGGQSGTLVWVSTEERPFQPPT